MDSTLTRHNARGAGMASAAIEKMCGGRASVKRTWSSDWDTLTLLTLLTLLILLILLLIIVDSGDEDKS